MDFRTNKMKVFINMFQCQFILMLILILFLFFPLLLSSQTAIIQGKILDKENNEEINSVEIFIDELGKTIEVNGKGEYLIKDIPYGNYVMRIFAEEYSNLIYELKVDQEIIEMDFYLEKLSIQLETTTITDKKEDEGIGKLRNVEEFGLYGGKKSEVIRIESIIGNVSTNNPREIFKGIAGLNIHENDGAGLQLSIGGRGLDPNRTANFNTRQNSYDISADALGYPESYYTPPVQALKKIEIVRGAASLQYGSQFGGLLNFIFKDGHKTKAFNFISENTYGSNNLFNTFNSIGGTVKKINYYSFFQYKRGDGFRPNSEFDQKTAFAKIKIMPNKKWQIGIEYTYMDYLSKQPGGLQDFEFSENPFQSKRNRNWFRVKWNLAALDFTYYINKKSRINSRNFFLYAGRDALGDLGPINRPDPLRERDLVMGKYKNFGNETRFLQQYDIKDKLSTFLVGFRYYQGFTENKQGFASELSDADFNFITEDPNKASYDFPSRNAAFFAENLFMITNKFSLTPGIRFEYIKTASDGYFYKRIYSGNDIVFEEKIDDAKKNKRTILLAGLGLSYQLKEELEIYANFSQNYRSINFTDLAIQNPNILVDSLLQDEKGFNFDLGIRGNLFKDKIKIDATAFALRYNNRIGIKDVIIQNEIGVNSLVDFRTNIGDALILGLETYIESDLIQFIKTDSDFKLIAFSNLSFIQGKYLSGGSDIKGNKVELIPPLNWKTGFSFFWKDFKTSFQYSLTSEHFSDATNATFVANATRGTIPTYSVMDFSAAYTWKWFTLSGGINNLGDSHYFTRRTTSYPGPGIIPAQGRNYYLSLKLDL